jgi:hypothetical protein
MVATQGGGLLRQFFMLRRKAGLGSTAVICLHDSRRRITGKPAHDLAPIRDELLFR